MNNTIYKIVFTFASLAMISAVVGIFGGMIFESMKVLVIGLGCMFLFFCFMILTMMYDTMFN